jgi:hypothetical protein
MKRVGWITITQMISKFMEIKNDNRRKDYRLNWAIVMTEYAGLGFFSVLNCLYCYKDLMGFILISFISLVF